MSAAHKPDDFFNTKQIRRLIALMEKHDLAEVDLKNADQRVRIKRGGEVVVSPPASPARWWRSSSRTATRSSSARSW